MTIFEQTGGNSTNVSPTQPLPVTILAPGGAPVFTTAAVQTITAGTTAQTVFAANSTREYLIVINTSDTAMQLEVTGAAATATSIPLAANGGFYEPLVAPTSAISILCATTGKTFVAKQA